MIMMGLQRDLRDLFDRIYEMFVTKYFSEAVVAVKTVNRTQNFLKYHFNNEYFRAYYLVFSQSDVKFHFTQDLKRIFRKIASYFSKYKVTFQKLF